MTIHRPRRTQTQRRETTRALILNSTSECLLERGYPATTISEIQGRTGLGRGTILHHFPTRADLLIAATTHVVDKRIELFRREAQSVPSDQDRLEALVELAWRDLNSPVFFTAVELWVAARTDPNLRTKLIEEERRVFAEMREVYAGMLGTAYEGDPRAAILVEFTIDMLTGLSMTTMLTGVLGEREATLRQWKRALAVLVGTVPADELVAGRLPRLGTRFD